MCRWQISAVKIASLAHNTSVHIEAYFIASCIEFLWNQKKSHWNSIRKKFWIKSKYFTIFIKLFMKRVKKKKQMNKCIWNQRIFHNIYCAYCTLYNQKCIVSINSIDASLISKVFFFCFNTFEMFITNRFSNMIFNLFN